MKPRRGGFHLMRGRVGRSANSRGGDCKLRLEPSFAGIHDGKLPLSQLSSTLFKHRFPQMVATLHTAIHQIQAWPN